MIRNLARSPALLAAALTLAALLSMTFAPAEARMPGASTPADIGAALALAHAWGPPEPLPALASTSQDASSRPIRGAQDAQPAASPAQVQPDGPQPASAHVGSAQHAPAPASTMPDHAAGHSPPWQMQAGSPSAAAPGWPPPGPARLHPRPG